MNTLTVHKSVHTGNRIFPNKGQVMLISRTVRSEYDMNMTRQQTGFDKVFNMCGIECLLDIQRLIKMRIC